jgi:hypothetical protein
MVVRKFDALLIGVLRTPSGVYSGCFVVEHRCLISTPGLKGIWYGMVYSVPNIKCVKNLLLIQHLLGHILI